VERRCKPFGSSDRTGVGGCGSQSGSNSAVSGWWEERENTGERVRHGFEKCLGIGLSLARLSNSGPSVSRSDIQAGHSPAIIKFSDFSLTFPDISSEYLRSIDPCNSSNTKRNACYFSLQYSYILSQL